MPNLIEIDPRALAMPARNPNHMSAADFETLRAAIRQSQTFDNVGLLQPVLARKREDGRLEIIDGAHRTQAAIAEGIPLVSVVAIDCTSEQAAKLQVGMNKLRGALDVGEVARIFAELDVTAHDVDACLTGYDAAGIDDMLRLYTESQSLAHEDATPADGLLGSDRDRDSGDRRDPDEGEEYGEAAARPFSFELSFVTSEERDAAKRGLRKAAGGGRKADLSAGLLRLIRGK